MVGWIPRTVGRGSGCTTTSGAVHFTHVLEWKPRANLRSVKLTTKRVTRTVTSFNVNDNSRYGRGCFYLNMQEAPHGGLLALADALADAAGPDRNRDDEDFYDEPRKRKGPSYVRFRKFNSVDLH